MRIHLIAIGGAAMHNLAIALHCNHHTVTGSDDEIYEPSRSRLDKKGLLPAKLGWNPENINSDIEAIILGMHAKPDNPELAKAQELGLKIYSYPEFIYEHAQEKNRHVIAGSHGKTTTTAMLLHAISKLAIDADYLVGAQLEGYDTMVRLSDAPNMIIEGDEYLSSPIDRRPKIFHYHPQVCIITGVAWDHVNVFPTFKEYLRQFELFLDTLAPGSTVIYYAADEHLTQLLSDRPSLNVLNYKGYQTASGSNGTEVVAADGRTFPISIFGRHNLQNLQAAALMAAEMGIAEHDFLKAMQTFTGASKRLQLLAEGTDQLVYQDFAHAPSKVKATVQAVRERYPDHRLLAVVELHTYSSLNKDFLPEYHGALDLADQAIVFYQEHTLKMKRLPAISVEDVQVGFGNPELQVLTDKEELYKVVSKGFEENTVLLLMSSGTFGGKVMKEWGDELVGQ